MSDKVSFEWWGAVMRWSESIGKLKNIQMATEFLLLVWLDFFKKAWTEPIWLCLIVEETPWFYLKQLKAEVDYPRYEKGALKVGKTG